MTACYTPDAYLMAEGIHPPQGHAAIREFWDATIWQRDPDGIWRIAVDISTPLPPPVPS